MGHLEHIFSSYNVDLFMRVLSAICLGFIIGFEREITNKYAGLRTHILVCLGACVFTIISIFGFPELVDWHIEGYNPTGVRDTARVAAQVVTYQNRLGKRVELQKVGHGEQLARGNVVYHGAVFQCGYQQILPFFHFFSFFLYGVDASLLII